VSSVQFISFGNETFIVRSLSRECTD